MFKRPYVFIVVLLVCGLVTFAMGYSKAHFLEGQESTGAPASAPLAVSRPPAEDEQWTTAAKDPSSSRYSGLDQITHKNGGGLKPMWSYVTGVKRGHEAAPLVVGDTMYITTPLPERLIAFDLKQPGAHVKWIYDPHIVPAAEGAACCDVINRGAVYSNGKIIYNLLDVETVAVDAYCWCPAE